MPSIAKHKRNLTRCVELQTQLFDLLRHGSTVAEISDKIKKSAASVEREIRWHLLIKLCDEICPDYFSGCTPWTSTEEETLLEMARSVRCPSTIAEELGRKTWEIKLQLARIHLAHSGPNDRGVEYRALPDDIQFDPQPYHQLYRKLLEHSVSFTTPFTVPVAPKQGENISLNWRSFVLVMSQISNLHHDWIAKRLHFNEKQRAKLLQNLEKAITCIRDLHPAEDNEAESESADQEEKGTTPNAAKQSQETIEMSANPKREREEHILSHDVAKKLKTADEDIGEPCFNCGKHGHHQQDCVAPRICHVCQKPDHSWLRCPVAARERKEWRKELGMDFK